MEDTTRVINRLIKEIQVNGSCCDSIDADTKLIDIPLNSLSFVRLIIAIENALDIEFGDEGLRLDKYPTIKDLILYIEYLRNI